MTDAQAEQESSRIGLALCLDRSEQIIDRCLRPPLAPDQLLALGVQAKNVGGRMEQAVAKETLDRGRAEPLDVHCPAAGKMAQALDALRRADQAAGTADI